MVGGKFSKNSLRERTDKIMFFRLAFIIDYLLSLLGIKVHHNDSDDKKSKEEREKKKREMEEDPNRVKLRYSLHYIHTDQHTNITL